MYIIFNLTYRLRHQNPFFHGPRGEAPIPPFPAGSNEWNMTEGEFSVCPTPPTPTSPNRKISRDIFSLGSALPSDPSWGDRIEAAPAVRPIPPISATRRFCQGTSSLAAAGWPSNSSSWGGDFSGRRCSSSVALSTALSTHRPD